jgi:predicted SAM-dependent methyltransferase
MNSNIYITLDEKTSDNNNVFINNIPKIINYSCDSIYVDCLEYLKEEDIKKTIQILSNKLKLGGKLIVSIYNAKSIALTFLNESISTQSFLQFFQHKQTILNLDNLYTFIDFQSMKITDLDISETNIKLIIERSSL